MRQLSLLPVLVVIVAALPAAARAQTSTPPVANAAHLEGSIAIDGKLDEAAWQRATPITSFRQYQPTEGAAASLPMEVRVLYDDAALYIGARLSQPGGVAAPLARRDQLLDSNGNNGSFNSLTTDKLIIDLDPYHNHLDDAWFEVNPAGVKGDQFNGDPSWDPIWEAAAQSDSLGWSAEMRIPYSQLRFSRDTAQTWGMQIWRYLDARNEHDMWSFWGQKTSGGPTLYGTLTGLQIANRPRQMELLPYAVAGSSYAPVAPNDPYHNGHAAHISAGADLKYLLTSNLTLDATLNPDFGQVEVDPASLNLSAYETYYDEKRPFFVAGSSAFDFGGNRCMFCSNSSGLDAFYSRRIGRPPQLNGYVSNISSYADLPDNTTILGAAKITGRTQKGYTIGLLDAVTSSETAHFMDARIGLPEGSQVVEPFTNYFVGRVKKDFNKGNTFVGAILTSTERSLSDSILSDRLRSHAEAVGLDWFHAWHNRDYDWMGSFLSSNVAGSTSAIGLTQQSSTHYFQRPDRTTAVFDPTLTSMKGYGLYTRVAKDGGSWLWELMTNVISPGLELNDLAFQSRTDLIWINGNVGHTWTTPTSWYRNISATVGGATQYNYDGDHTYAAFQAYYGQQFPNYWNLRMFYIQDPTELDDRLTRGGPVVVSNGYRFGHFQVSTDARRTAVFDFTVEAAKGIDASTHMLTLAPGVALKPAANIFIQLAPSYSRDEDAAQYVTAVADPTATSFFGNRYVFAFVKTKTVSLDTRINWTFTPNLTLQLFAQPFVASGSYSHFREFARPRTIEKLDYGRDVGSIAYDAGTNSYRIDPDAGGPAASFVVFNPNFTTTSLRGTAVLRWEYRPGSTIFFVWTQQRSGFDPAGDFDFTSARRQIFNDRPANVFQIKATYWIGR